jgi:hypothetical protein
LRDVSRGRGELYQVTQIRLQKMSPQYANNTH